MGKRSNEMILLKILILSNHTFEIAFIFFSHLTLVIPIRKAERPRLNWSQFS